MFEKKNKSEEIEARKKEQKQAIDESAVPVRAAAPAAEEKVVMGDAVPQAPKLPVEIQEALVAVQEANVFGVESFVPSSAEVGQINVMLALLIETRKVREEVAACKEEFQSLRKWAEK